MTLVNNHENSNKISTTEHLTKSTNHKTEATNREGLNSTPATNIPEETTAESFYNTFDKKDQNAATEVLKEKVINQASEMQNGEKEEVDQRAKKSKKTVFIVGDSMIKKDRLISRYLLTKSINHKFLVKVRPFTTAKTTDMYDHLKPTLRHFNLGLFIIYVRGGSRTAATSKMECFVIIVNGFQALTIITKHSILDVSAILDPPLHVGTNDHPLNKPAMK